MYSVASKHFSYWQILL